MTFRAPRCQLHLTVAPDITEQAMHVGRFCSGMLHVSCHLLSNSSVHVCHLEKCATRLTIRHLITRWILSRLTQMFTAYGVKNLAPSLDSPHSFRIIHLFVLLFFFYFGLTFLSTFCRPHCPRISCTS